MTPKENRVPIMMSDEQLTAIDEWRFENRIATRSKAIRVMCQMVLDRAAKPRVRVKAVGLPHDTLGYSEGVQQQHREFRLADGNFINSTVRSV